MCVLYVACLWMCVLFCFFFVCLHVCAYAFKSKVRCGSALGPGVSGLPYYCTPPLFVPAVLGGLAVWRHTNKQKKERMEAKNRWMAKKRCQHFNHDSVGRFRCYRCSTLINYNSYPCTEAFFDYIEWPEVWLRFVFILDFWHNNYSSFLGISGSGIHHFGWINSFLSQRYEFGTCGNRISISSWFASFPLRNSYATKPKP